MSAVAPGARRHGAQAHRQDGRRVSRARRRVPRSAGIGSRHARDRRQSRRRRTKWRLKRLSFRTTTRRRSRRRSPGSPARSRRSSSSPSPRTWASCLRSPGYLEAVRDLRAPRRAADLRRGHHRVSRGARAARRSSTASARPDHARQDRRRRPAGGSVRRLAGSDGARGALGPRLPGRHALGNPLAMAAGIAMLHADRAPSALRGAREQGRRLESRVREAISDGASSTASAASASARSRRSSSRQGR